MPWRRRRPEEPQPDAELVAEDVIGGELVPDEEDQAPEGKASWELQPGDEFAPGRLAVKALGGGSSYEAYLAWDDTLFSLVVAKILRPDRSQDQDSLDDLRVEVEMLERLAHPTVVRSFGSVLEGEYPHVLLEYLDGPTLRRLIRRHGVMPIEQLIPLAVNVVAALHYIAAQEVVHLDVKPSNIVMGVPPRLLDFSVARSFERARRIRGHIGTDPYMAPEQCDPKQRGDTIGPPADVWGLGVTLYEGIAGRRPFDRPDEDAEELEVQYPQLVDDPYPLPREVPEPLQELLLRMLDKDPAQRPVAADVAAGLEPLLSRRPRPVRWTRVSRS